MYASVRGLWHIPRTHELLLQADRVLKLISLQSENPAKRARAIVQAVRVPCGHIYGIELQLNLFQVTHFNNPKILAEVGH